ncbi:MAG: DUF4331 domain-containing protein [bacterium]|nr:DUF4331 domain-containing protein [bacterium]
MTFNRTQHQLGAAILSLSIVLSSSTGFASSHMDAPLITRDPSANTTDVYAFRSASEDGTVQYLTTALAVYPFEAPGIGPNNYSFDDNVLYEIHVALGDDVAAGRKTFSYQFKFDTTFKNENIILQAFLGVIQEVDDANQNLTQTYTVTKVDHDTGDKTYLGSGVVPPNNQGLLTPKYNQGNNGESPAKEGVNTEDDLDDYTKQAIADLSGAYRAFAGQRDDGFYADIQSIFDLDFTFSGPNKPFDSQGGFNVHTIVLQIPLSDLGDASRAGVYATTSRRRITILSRKPEKKGDLIIGKWIQVGRQGNPLFNEGFVSIKDKDLYNRTDPTHDQDLFSQYALNPQLAAVLGLPATGRDDIAGIFIPDLIKVDLSTGPARLAGDPDDIDFNRLSVFGDDTLINEDDTVVAGGFPNGRRFGDDVLDIALIALGVPIAPDPGIDRVMQNDITFNKVMPYAATPLNGRNHAHH